MCSTRSGRLPGAYTKPASSGNGGARQSLWSCRNRASLALSAAMSCVRPDAAWSKIRCCTSRGRSLHSLTSAAPNNSSTRREVTGRSPASNWSSHAGAGAPPSSFQRSNAPALSLAEDFRFSSVIRNRSTDQHTRNAPPASSATNGRLPAVLGGSSAISVATSPGLRGRIRRFALSLKLSPGALPV